MDKHFGIFNRSFLINKNTKTGSKIVIFWIISLRNVENPNISKYDIGSWFAQKRKIR